MLLGGNGVGKTCAMANFLAGMALGPDFVNKDFMNLGYFHDCQEIRSKRALKIRIVCDGADMEDLGSVYEQIKEWIPCATFSGKVSGKYFTKIRIPSPDPNKYKETIVDIKTHKQDKVAHAGSNLDAVLFNEPAPKKLYAEEKARVRNGGRVFMFLTPLELAAYLCDIIDTQTIRPDGELFWVKASIWDNCKDIPGTRGILTERAIRDLIFDWEAADPLEVDARVKGDFMHLGGSILKIFNEDVHTIVPKKIEPNWNIYMCVDPHPNKPHFALWVAVTPLNDVYVIAEYPLQNWKNAKHTHLTIRLFGREFNLIESGDHPDYPLMRGCRVKERFGDPNAFKAEYPNNRTTCQIEYENDCNLYFNIDVDNDVTLRLDDIKGRLNYDFKRPVKEMNRPSLYVFKTCPNTIMAMKYFSNKKRADGSYDYKTYDETWKDPIDTLGYILVSIGSWEQPDPRRGWGEESRETSNAIIHDPMFEVL